MASDLDLFYRRWSHGCSVEGHARLVQIGGPYKDVHAAMVTITNITPIRLNIKITIALCLSVFNIMNPITAPMQPKIKATIPQKN